MPFDTGAHFLKEVTESVNAVEVVASEIDQSPVMVTDFASILADSRGFAETVFLRRATSSVNYRGTETITFADPETITVIFVKRTTSVTRSEEGIYAAEPSIVLAKISDDLSTSDQIILPTTDDVYEVITVRNVQNIYLSCEVALSQEI